MCIVVYEGGERLFRVDVQAVLSTHGCCLVKEQQRHLIQITLLGSVG